MTTRTSVTSGNWRADDADTWGLGLNNYPAAGEHVVIDTGHTVTLGESNDAGSIKLIGTLAGGGHTLTLNDGGDNEIFDHDGTITGTLNITITGTTNRLLDLAGSSGNVNNLTINASSTTFTLSGTGTHTVAGNLTITAGTLDTDSSNNYALTVTGVTTIGDGTGGTPDEATLTCNASTCSFGSGVTADYGLKVKANGTFVGGTGTHTAGGFYMDNNPAAKATVTNDVMTINSEKTSANKAWRVEYGGDTFDNNNGTVKFHLNGFDSRFSMRSESHANNAFHNLIIDADTSARQISPDNGSKIIVDNDLTITNGKLVMGLSHELDVGRDIVIDDASGTAVLEMGSSSNISSQPLTARSITINSNGTYEGTSGTTIVFNSAASSYAFMNAGTYTPQGGTLQIGNGTTPAGGATHIRSNNYHHLTINTGQNAPDGNVPWRPNSGTEVTIAGDLTVTKGRFYRNNSSNSLVVTGNVDIAANGQVGTSSASGSNTFGSLSVASGGTYLATSGTTTINGDPGGYPNLGINLDGTFTHNNGTLKYTGGSGGLDLACTGNLYNFEHAPTGTTFITNNTTIENNLTMTGANFQGVNGNENLTVKGNVTINSSGQTMNFTGASEHTFGFLTILDGTYKVQNDTGGFTKVGGIRNVGGTVSNAV